MIGSMEQGQVPPFDLGILFFALSYVIDDMLDRRAQGRQGGVLTLITCMKGADVFDRGRSFPPF